MALIQEKYDGRRISFTKDGKVNIEVDQYPTIPLAITGLLMLNRPEERIKSEELRKNFLTILPDFRSITTFKKPMSQEMIPEIEKMAEAAEEGLRSLGLIKPVNIITTHPLRNELRHIFKRNENKDPILIETRFASTWLQFLQKSVEGKKDLSPLSYLTLGSQIQSNYFTQVERLVIKISESLGIKYDELKAAHELLKIVSYFMLNPRILYSQPYKKAAEDLQLKIKSINDPGVGGYDHLYIPGIKKVIDVCQREIRILLDSRVD